MYQFENKTRESEDEEKVSTKEKLFIDKEQVNQIKNLNIENFRNLKLSKELIEQPIFYGDVLCVALAKDMDDKNIDQITNKISHLISKFSTLDLSIKGKSGDLLDVILANKYLDELKKKFFLHKLYKNAKPDQKDQLFGVSIKRCFELMHSSNKNISKDALEKPTVTSNIGVFAREERQVRQNQNHTSMAASICSQIDELLGLADKIPTMKK